MDSIFETNPQIESLIHSESPKPDFFYLFLAHYDNQELTDLYNFIKDSKLENHIFLKGLYNEHGVHPLKEPNLTEAFKYYQEGAKLRESYCCFRLHFIYKNEFEQFSVKKDRFLEMINLIKSAAYFDEKDNRLNRKQLDPVMHLAVHLDNEDPDLIKTVECIERYKTLGDKEKNIGVFLHNWCCVRFSLSEFTKTECVNQLVALADHKDIEACCFLGETYRYGDVFKQDLNMSKKYFETGKAEGSIKAVEALAYVHQLTKRPDLSVENYALGAKLGSYTSLKIYGEYLIVGKFLKQDIERGIENVYYASLQCDFWAMLTLFEVFKYYELKEKKNLDVQIKMFNIAKKLFELKDKIGKIAHIRLTYTAYAECFEKGYYVQKNYIKATEILQESLRKIEVEKLKTFSYYRLGRINERQGLLEDASRYYDLCIRACIMMVEDPNIIKNQAYYYLLGKLFYLGRGTVRNNTKALGYLKEGNKMENFFYFGSIYSKKCNRLIQKIVNTTSKIVSLKSSSIYDKTSSESEEPQTINSIKDVVFEIYQGSIGPIKIFTGKFQGDPVKIHEFTYSSKKNYFYIINHLVKISSLSNQNIDKLITIAADPATCCVLGIYNKNDVHSLSLEDYYTMYEFIPQPSKNIFSCGPSLFCREDTSQAKSFSSGKRTNIATKIKMCQQLARAVGLLHAKGLVHGNLNPRNLLIMPGFDIVMVGYGVEDPRFYDTEERFASGKGIAEGMEIFYAAENFQKNRKVSHKSDVYSLGHMIYYIFEEKAMPKTASPATKKKTLYTEFSNDTPTEIGVLFDRCTCKTPEDRLSIGDVEHFLAGLARKFVK